MIPVFLRLSIAKPHIGSRPIPSYLPVFNVLLTDSNGITCRGSVSHGSVSRWSVSRGSIARGLLCALNNHLCMYTREMNSDGLTLSGPTNHLC